MKTRKGQYNEDGSSAVKPVVVEAPVVVEPEPEPPKTSGLGEAPESFDDGLEDLLSLTVTELKELADEEGVQLSKKATKSDIIAVIQGVQE